MKIIHNTKNRDITIHDRWLTSNTRNNITVYPDTYIDSNGRKKKKKRTFVSHCTSDAGSLYMSSMMTVKTYLVEICLFQRFNPFLVVRNQVSNENN